MPQTVTVSIKDDKNRVSKLAVNFADSATLAEVQAWLDEFMILAEPVTKGAWVSATITSALTIAPERRTVPFQTADVEEKLVAGFKAGNYRTSVTIATFDDAYTVPIVSTKERIPDFLQNEVQTLFNHFTVPALSGFVRLTDKRGVIIDKVDKSRYKHRR